MFSATSRSRMPCPPHRIATLRVLPPDRSPGTIPMTGAPSRTADDALRSAERRTQTTSQDPVILNPVVIILADWASDRKSFVYPCVRGGRQHPRFTAARSKLAPRTAGRASLEHRLNRTRFPWIRGYECRRESAKAPLHRRAGVSALRRASALNPQG